MKPVIQDMRNFNLQIPEDDLRRVITWDDVLEAGDLRTLNYYYLQRMGPGFKDVPTVKMSPKLFQELVFGNEQGEHDIYARMLHEAPEAARDLWFTYTVERERRVAMGMNIDSPNVGELAIQYIADHKTSEDHEKFLKEVVVVSNQCRRLYFQWNRAPVQFHKINLPEPLRDDAFAAVAV